MKPMHLSTTQISPISFITKLWTDGACAVDTRYCCWARDLRSTTATGDAGENREWSSSPDWKGAWGKTWYRRLYTSESLTFSTRLALFLHFMCMWINDAVWLDLIWLSAYRNSKALSPWWKSCDCQSICKGSVTTKRATLIRDLC